MAKSDGFLEIFTPVHKTKILPLRWIANSVFSKISHWAILKAVQLDENNPYAWDYNDLRKYRVYGKIYTIFQKPYKKWGTTYKYNSDNDLISKLDDGLGWDDYDEFGIPYWDYFWHEDPITGDAWRLVDKNDTIDPEVVN